jgi:hypothetical protein
MMRIPNRLLACVLVLSACGASGSKLRPPVESTSTESAAAAAALRAGSFREAEELANQALRGGKLNSEALVVRSISRYEQRAQHLGDELLQALELAEETERFDHAKIRKAFSETELALSEIDKDLAAAASDESFALDLCLACWERDWNRSGEIDERDRRLLEIEFAPDGTDLPEGDPRRRPTFRFDVGDIHWARAMIAFQRAAINLVLAYDGEELDKLFAIPLFGKMPETLVIRIKLSDPKRVAKARALILSGLEHSDNERKAYLAETDDEREWVPSPRQKNSPVPLAVDNALYETWSGVISDLRGLVRGDTGISLGELGRLAGMPKPPSGYLDVGQMLSHPKDLVFDIPAMSRHDLDGPNADAEGLARDVFGSYYVKHMRATPLIGRLARMAGELVRGEESLDRKLRYLFWIN